MTTDNKGVIYYKLDPDYHYEGDFTKNCGLNGGEIDGNFHFLRGYDISSFEISPNNEELFITRLNGEKLSVSLKEHFQGYDFEYDSSKGILKITMPYGETIDLEGFLTDNSFRVYTDSTINGDGTKYNPFRVASSFKTGVYKPSKAFIDLTKEDASLPSQNVKNGDRYVTKEIISKHGLLYPLSGVKELSKRLEEMGSEWRVPTKSDWDSLLNMIETCDEGRNHESIESNKILGMNAGAYLKSMEKWELCLKKIEDGEIVVDGKIDETGEYIKISNSENKFGFSIYPSGFGDSRGVESIGGYGKWAAYWTSTEEDNHEDMYVKVFSHEERGVAQNTWGEGCYLSLRLVKNYTGGNLYDIETIDGNAITTKFIPNDDEGVYGALIWTAENVSFPEKVYGGVKSPEWYNAEDDAFEVRHYINEWDGKKWIKTEMLEGESVVIGDYNGNRMHEWRLIDGELFDADSFFKDELLKTIEALAERIAYFETEEYKAKIYNEYSDKIFRGISGTAYEVDVKYEYNATKQRVKGVQIGFSDNALFGAEV